MSTENRLSFKRLEEYSKEKEKEIQRLQNEIKDAEKSYKEKLERYERNLLQITSSNQENHAQLLNNVSQNNICILISDVSLNYVYSQCLCQKYCFKVGLILQLSQYAELSKVYIKETKELHEVINGHRKTIDDINGEKNKLWIELVDSDRKKLKLEQELHEKQSKLEEIEKLCKSPSSGV